MRVYADTSFLISLLTPDVHTPRAEQLVQTGVELAYSTWARVDFCGAVNAKARSLKPADAAELWRAPEILDSWAARVGPPIGVLAEDPAAAERLVRRREVKLRAPDALHIAIATRLDLPIATFDNGMIEAAGHLGIQVLP